MPTRTTRLALGLGLLLVAVLLSDPVSSAARPSLAAYRGLGSWLDIYETDALDDPEGTVLAMKSYGVRTIFIETSNYNRAKAILYPDLVGAFLDAAHREGMRVVAWYLPDFARLKRDLERSMAATLFRSASGQRFDSFALDIEASVVEDPAARSRRLLALSAEIRAAVGPSYPLGAITPNPVRLATDTGFWPDFPYGALTQYFDVFVPMDYFGSVAGGLRGAHDYTAQAIDLIREGTGDPTVPIHVIGGIADDLNDREVRGFVHAVRERGVLGASLYNFSVTGSEDWAEMRSVPVNPRGSPALPVLLGDQRELGNIPGSDRTHPQEVFYVTGGQAGSFDLSYQGFDVQTEEVQLWVNWRPVGPLDRSRGNAWSTTRIVRVADSFLKDAGTNYIAFVAAGRYPDWSTWGVRAVTLTPAA